MRVPEPRAAERLRGLDTREVKPSTPLIGRILVDQRQPQEIGNRVNASIARHESRACDGKDPRPRKKFCTNAFVAFNIVQIDDLRIRLAARKIRSGKGRMQQNLAIGKPRLQRR